ncbi:tyrosine-type recombinase/integrase [soil metagenome]
MTLTNTEVQKAKAAEKPFKLSDGRGLYLLVQPTGSKLWRWKYRAAGKEKLMALGKYPDVGLAQARHKVDEARKLHAAGGDPMVVRRSDKIAALVSAENSFHSVAKVWHAQWKGDRSARHALSVWRRLEIDVFPAVGARPISDIKTLELVAMVKKIAERGALDMAKRCLQMSGQVFRYAVAHELAERNPVTDIKPADILPSRRKKNFARVDATELPVLLRKIEGYAGAPPTRLAIKLMALTFVRTGELIGAKWSEFDLDGAQWRIPAERMKMRDPHIVPLSRQAVEVLKTLHLITGGRELLFPGERDHAKPISNNTILGALKRMGHAGRMTGHGFRGVASTILHEQGFDHAHIELQLAHLERNAVSASYNHATYLAPRAKMMQAWGDHLDELRMGNVLTFEKRAA